MTRERDRYRTKSVAEQIGDVGRWLWDHKPALALVVLFAVGIVVQLIAPQRSARPGDLSVGDCLFVPTASRSDVQPGARPIGHEDEVEAVLMSGGAEQTDCGASHGHEVSAMVDLVSGPAVGQEASVLRATVLPTCEATFEAFVGHSSAGSAFTTFAAVPTAEAWAAGNHRAVCLVTRVDGQWLTRQARSSGE